MAEEDTHDDGYKPAEKVDLSKLREMDSEDESLRKYKDALLGAAMSEDIAPKNDPRRVVIKRMEIICEDRPGGNIIFDLEEKGSELKMKDRRFVLKEGCNYKTKIQFKIQHEIVSGLKLMSTVYKKGIRISSEDEMFGSFPPQKNVHDISFPRHGWEKCPSGLLARGDYKGKHRFLDDDKVCHLEYDYCFAIKKDWGDNSKD